MVTRFVVSGGFAIQPGGQLCKQPDFIPHVTGLQTRRWSRLLDTLGRPPKGMALQWIRSRTRWVFGKRLLCAGLHVTEWDAVRRKTVPATMVRALGGEGTADGKHREGGIRSAVMGTRKDTKQTRTEDGE